MTKRERVLRTVRFEETDRIPLYDVLENDAVIEHYTGQKLTVADGTRLQCLAIGRILDMVRMVGGPSEPGERVDEQGMRLRQLRWTSWIVERPWRDMAGLVEWVKKEIKRINGLTFDRAYAEALHQRIRGYQALFAQGDPTGRGDPTVFVLESGAGLTEMYWATEIETFSYLMSDYADLVEEWLDARNRMELRRVAAIANPDLIPIALTYDDIAYKNGPIFSPAWLRKHWLPRLKALNEAWHTRDTYCLFHSDGNLFSVLDDLVAAGIDGLNPLEVLAGMTVKAVRERYPRLFLTGGVDVSQLLCFGTPEEVRAACRENIAAAGGRGYFLGSSTELHWEVKLENAIAMFETAWEARS
ncbi:MAG: uroporphyrinogen decarboxylase family protein [Anaerolineae bacterium]